MERAFGEISATIGALLDDLYRSLASALRRAGGLAKKLTPFSESAWADFLRGRVSREALAVDFGAAIGQALILARSPVARDLPGSMPEPKLRLDASAPSASPSVAR